MSLPSLGPPAAAPATATDGDGRTAGKAKPTVVLVHGAFADASGWNEVAMRLQHRGHEVVAPANPLRGLGNDSSYTASVLKSIKGPIVLVGHSYGGAVISSAAAGNPNVKALVAEAAAWKSIPSWFLVARQDKDTAPDLERFEAERAGSRTVEIDSSHVAMMSHPETVVGLIDEAAETTC
ncbi:alpha/beta fold hydrolase [Streptomyces sp. NPDC053541]|uniref:alpha/beta fold hydrolase n=1 Tax=Streptomyces sp. NPDC053541 TaxID=3365709 RepID=UPI0037D93A96